MTRVGVRQLKDRLSQQLRTVKAGGEIIITERGVDIARLSPVAQAPIWVQEMVAQGAATWQGGKPAGLPTPGRRRAGKLASDYVIEMRR